MHKYFFSFLLVLFTFLAFTSAQAIVGFVPNGGLWFSKTDLKPGEPATVFTVVVNNEYALITGAVIFYDNNDPIGTTPVTVVKDQAAVVKTTWQPKNGTHGVYAKLSGSAQQKVDGPAIALPTTVLNGNLATIINTTLDQPLGSAVTVVVNSDGSKKIISPMIASTAVAGEKIIAPPTSTANINTTNTAGDIFSKNKEILDNATHISSLTSTANSVGQVYEQGKDFVSTSQAYYAKAQGVWAQIQPYIEKVTPVWNWLSNNNEPKRIIIIVVVVLIILAILRRI
jgi:hypothetical protein